MQNRKVIVSLLYIVFILTGSKSYAQYNPKRVDSMFNKAAQINDIKQKEKQGIEIYRVSKAINYQEGIAKGLMICSGACFNSGRYEKAFKYAAEAESQVPKIHDAILITQILTAKGTVFNKLGYYKEAWQTLNNAIVVAKKISDPDAQHYWFGNIYTALGQYKQSCDSNLKATFFYTRESYREFKHLSTNVKYIKGYILATYNMGSIFLDLHQIDSASLYLHQAAIFAEKYHDDNVCAFTYNELGNLYYQQKQYNDAATYYTQNIVISTRLGNAYQLKDACKGLSKVYFALKQNDRAAKCLERYTTLTDSLNKVDKLAVEVPLAYLFKTRDEKNKENKSQLIWLIVAILLLLIIVVFIAVFISRKLKRKLKQSIATVNKLTKATEVNATRLKMDDLKEIVHLAMENNPLFLTRFNQYDPEFVKNILFKAPNMVAVEIEMCVLLRINFDTKEIARFTNSSVRSVEGKKRRIRKKLSIPSAIDINVWMTNV
ncbi:tetratricopeptide repeat protein [Mucilaginibacter sp. FT3.2]|uniref:tetratricopeptide repeat protein n=1 Tax=Mucilaginibacter sp. FT3.2 TaxID=2723090 RepID=UPI0016083940|nr:tetratricopeptide (TPR) repeat protein [Mucilaginibacter sp. FT3.2]